MLGFNEVGNIGLFEEICSMSRLKESFVSVLKNKGAPGVDGITVEKFSDNLGKELSKLQRDLWTWAYEPQAVRRVEIPKANGVRKLGIPTVRDRVVATAIKEVLEPIFEEQFSESSYGFRPYKGQQQAIAAAQKIVGNGKEYVIDIDLAQFFDRVCHDRLIYRLSERIGDKRVLKLIGMMLRSGVLENGLVKATTEGTTQGSPLSPLLSNIVLDELDKELEKRGHEFVRFADDCNIFVRSQAAAERVMTTVKKFIEKKLKLKVNEDKSKVAKSDKVKFLGMTILKGSVAVAIQSFKKAMTKVKELTPRGTNMTMEETLEVINRWYRGWFNYYRMTYYPSQLRAIEAHVRRRLRARLVVQQKRPRFLYAKLMEMGVNKQQACKIAYSRRGPWTTSHMRGVESAFSNSWFKSKGQLTFSKEEQPHWFELKVWIKLTEEPCT
jgi:group II intron reverse transcriptase/maturase